MTGMKKCKLSSLGSSSGTKENILESCFTKCECGYICKKCSQIIRFHNNVYKHIKETAKQTNNQTNKKKTCSMSQNI